MSASIRATTKIEGNSVTLEVVAMTAPPPPPPPIRVAVSRRGSVVTIKKGSIDIVIDIPSNPTKPVTVNARGRAVCNAPTAKSGPKKKAKKAVKRAKRSLGGATAAMTDPPPPPKEKLA
jgi:hypothetical protein